ncbi:MAG: hypothetical protein ABSD74_16150 [Rhizomicrobium sp.]|jgi:hypothetical protein
MIPLLLVLRVRGDRTINLWLPLFLVWLLLLPVVLLLLPVALAALIVARINPWRAIAASWGVLAALRGTHVEVAAARHTVFVHVY